MPTYVYKCRADGYVKEVLHRIGYSTGVTCDCGELMHRVPQAPLVNWGGLPPHREHEVGPAARDLIDNYDRNREAYIAKQEQRGKYLRE